MTGNYKAVRGFTILGALVATFVLIDGLVLFFTNGLNSDATPVFPVLGGAFTKTRSSGTSLIIMGVMIAVVTFVGWWTLGRRLRAEEQREATKGGTHRASDQSVTSQSATAAQHDG